MTFQPPPRLRLRRAPVDWVRQRPIRRAARPGLIADAVTGAGARLTGGRTPAPTTPLKEAT
ncbi:hypothetical protein NX794_17675 [Streptomyces sp. LP11]|uniref:Uncharacterized protein n=1 Tax=Streptomyces pyxinicus TaxID=2970331 RepID=A0ABT2B3C0_9ACTN|nr:hypothetical protein [Streptomyces sp. LP11]MCS0603029.1 hypothetical protein [Streptomyces sp. LP11]